MTGIFIIGKNGEFAQNEREIANIKEDKQYFYKCIQGKRVYVGRKTFRTLPTSVLNLPATWCIYNRDYQDDWDFLRNSTCKMHFFTDIEIVKRIEQYHQDNDEVEQNAICIGGAKLIEELVRSGCIHRLDVTVVMNTFPNADVILSPEVFERMTKENLVEESVLQNKQRLLVKHCIYKWD